MNLPGSVLRYLNASWRHRWLGLAVAWLVCTAGWIVVYKLPNTYQASARLYAEADAILGQTLRGIAVDGAPQQQVDLLTRTLLARPNLERVVARTDLDMRVHDAASREALITALGRDIRVLQQGRSLFAITYSDHDPRVAHAVVRTLLDLFMESAANNDRQQMQNARSFVNQQIAAYETQLREAERRRAEFRSRYLDLLPSETLGGASRLESSRDRLNDLRGQLEDARLRQNVLRQQIDALPVPTPQQQQAAQNPRLEAAERDLRELRTRFTENHPAVVAQRTLIAELRASDVRTGPVRPAAPPATTQRDLLQSRMVDIDLAITSLERQIRSETAEIARLEALARTMPQLQMEFSNLDRDYGVLRRQYEELLARRESLQVAGAARAGADQVRLDVVEPPTVPLNPTGPNRLLFAAAVLVVGLGAGAGLAILLGMFDRSFYSLRDLREIGLPVLGSISSVNPPSRAIPLLVFGSGTAALMAVFGLFLWRGTELVARGTALVARAIT